MLHASQFKDRKTFMMMVGLPGSGKDYWIQNFLDTYIKEDRDNWLALGTDDIYEEWAARDGITYSQAFDRYAYKDVDREFRRRINEAFAMGQNVIWNQTNMGANPRKKKLRLVPEDYYKMAMVVTVSDIVLNEQLKKREAETGGGKVIPEKVIKQMASSYARPTKDEGWDKIMDIKR